MSNDSMFLWLVYAGLGVQLTTSHKAIDTMAIALAIPSSMIPSSHLKKAKMAKELIDWQFNNKRKPRWMKDVLPE